MYLLGQSKTTSKGIGAALARRLAADGFQVVVNYAASAAEAEQVAAAIEQAGGRARAVQADVADPAAMRELFDRAEAAFGPVDVLVNNAGVLKAAPLAEVSDQDYQRQLAVNLTGTFNGLREGARRVRDGGRLITSEFEPSKVARARQNLEAGGLADLVEIRVGDALQTLSVDLPERIDLLLLDGAKSLYTEILDRVEGRLRPGALVVADNADYSPDYLARVRSPAGGYLSLPFDEDVELSMRLG
ncbi:SDR family NAD(P)-dependent oxidoreductase [Burkholderia multivorans]|nr:SDR family NAD(P)-dependent oxidoreductase [Burkholderia multivorans]UQN70995.1 SDR family NAD(P)-dependent oxidoreductase [Burkholderia multivorans]UQN76729.1 SDR family NAD(P)-dependent oxidoreductase [Burkholderia multivorans]